MLTQEANREKCYKIGLKVLSLLGRRRFTPSQIFTAVLVQLVVLSGVFCKTFNQIGPNSRKYLEIKWIFFSSSEDNL